MEKRPDAPLFPPERTPESAPESSPEGTPEGAPDSAAKSSPPSSAALPQAAPTVHAPAWARAQAQWAAGRGLPWLHREVARRMAERLPIIRAEPTCIVEWDADAGQSGSALQAAYPHARWVPVSPAVHVPGPEAPGIHPPRAEPDARHQGMLKRWTWPQRLLGRLIKPSTAHPPESPTDHPRPPAQTAHRLLLESAALPGQAQLLWSNLGLHTRAHPQAVLQRWHEVLAVDGFLMFSAFGPDTLKELRALWTARGWGPPSQAFRDMHDWGDDLVAAGFADPVMDQETITLTWAHADAALAELRTLGRNAHPGRVPGCRTPRWLHQVKADLQALAGPDGRIGLSFEIVYGHAFRPAPRARVTPITAVSLDDMRSLVQSARRSG